MKIHYSRIAALIISLVLLNLADSFACTSVIVSAKATASGKPLMFKNRDTGELNNRIEYFQGPEYTFIGLVNSPVKDGIPEVWTGTNSAGFSIMNTASYNIKDDDVPYSEMDREGEVMYKALGICSTLEDFENLLDTLKRPMGVEANFGVIDAFGGAAYYEVNNHKWIKYDVNETECGYRVMTNFSESGDPDKYQGWDRYCTASAVMKELQRNEEGKYDIDHRFFFSDFSRSYRQENLGIKDLKDKDSYEDNNFIPRRSTSASTVVEGVVPGDNPKYTVMWTVLGYPPCGIAVPMVVGKRDIIPFYMKKSEESENSILCDNVLKVKYDYVFDTEKSEDGKYYLNSRNAYQLIECAQEVDSYIFGNFSDIYQKWVFKDISSSEFYSQYIEISNEYYDKYLSCFASFIKND